MSSISLWGRRLKNSLFCLAVVFALAACDNAQKTVEKLRVEIADFQTAPNDAKRLEIEKNFIKLEEQINRLEEKNDPLASELDRQYSSLQTTYQTTRMANAMKNVKDAMQNFGEAVRTGAKEIGDSFRGTTNGN